MTEKYRNANGVYMKMMNFRRLEPGFQSQGKSGLKQGSKGEEDVWRRFEGDRPGLRAAASGIKARIESSGSSSASNDAADAPAVDPALFDAAWARFNRLVAANSKGRPFISFDEGVAAAWKDYKPRLRDRALAILASSEWSEAEIGTGAILDRVIAAIEIQEPRVTLTNNLVFWQNRYGHANRDHKALLEGRADRKLGGVLEQLLFDLYRGDADEGGTFDRLSELTGAKYPLVAYLFFLKDADRFMPIQPTTFDRAFRDLGIALTTLRQCSWENYRDFNAALNGVREALAGRIGSPGIRLVDAHSFCWMLEQLPDGSGKRNAPTARDVGRVVGGREKAIIAMRYSIEETARNSNGQLVQRTVKNKDQGMSSAELEKLIRTLLDIQGDRCMLTGIPFEFDNKHGDKSLMPSADRIDSSGHYELGNLQIVCRFINFWKRDSANDDFKHLLKIFKVSSHHERG